MDSTCGKYEQKIAYARASLWAPFYTVGMAVRIRGNVLPDLVKKVICKIQTLYPPLGSRVRLESDGSAWLTTEGVGECQLVVHPKNTDDDWGKLFLEQERIPFSFVQGPIARFFLLQGEQNSDLVAVVPHVICDGYSMMQVMTDMVALLNDPEREVEMPNPFPVVSWQTVPHAAGDQIVLRGLARLFNRTWTEQRKILQQEEYEELHHRYWENRKSCLITCKLTPAETSSLATRCKQHGLSITGALMAAFLLAQAEIQPSARWMRREISMAINLRDRMIKHPGKAVGIYASSIDLDIQFKSGMSFWKLAREGHYKIHQALKDRPRVLLPLVLDEIDPSILDGLVTALVNNKWSKGLKFLTLFAKVNGENRYLNISNIGRIDTPEENKTFRLETILPFPPLDPAGKLMVNTLTVNGLMNIIMKFNLDVMSYETAIRVKERALEFILAA